MAGENLELLPSFVWGETGGLNPRDEKSKLERLWSVVGNIGNKANIRGLLDQMKRAGAAVPTADIEIYSRMKEAVTKAVQSPPEGEPLPQQAALWQIDSEGRPHYSESAPAWIYSSSTKSGGEFSGPDGKLYRLCELAEPPVAGALGYISAYSRTGLAVRRWTVPPSKVKAAWIVGIIAFIAFLLGGLCAVWSGRSDGNVLARLKDAELQYKVIDKLADICIADSAAFPNRKPAICGFVIDTAGVYVKPQPVASATKLPYAKSGETAAGVRKCLDGSPLTPADPKPTEAAIADASVSCELAVRGVAAAGLIGADPIFPRIDKLLSSLLGSSTLPGNKSILVQFLMTTIGIAGLAIALGLGTKGRWDGIWIDERQRVSLARAQVTLWTVVALAGFATIAMFNVGLATPTSFPQIPAAIAAALGIAFASPMVSALILNTKSFGLAGSPSDQVTTVAGLRPTTNDFANRGTGLAATGSSTEARANPTEASIADVFMGEQVDNVSSIDISRLQNVVLTVTLVLGYLSMLVEQLRNIAPEKVLLGLQSFPDPGGAFTAVLLISHATYLGTKAYNASGGQEPAQ